MTPTLDTSSMSTPPDVVNPTDTLRSERTSSPVGPAVPPVA
jgi:hypothetical protein